MILLISIFIIILLFFFYINKIFIVEHFCKIPKLDSQGGINDKKVLLDYAPQSNILTSSCDQYWKKWPLESNSTQIDDEPIVIKSNQLELPKEKQFADNSYIAGLIDFNKIADLVNDKINYDIFSVSSEMLIDPRNKKNVNYEYEVQFAYDELNKDTWINRWDKYNPNTFVAFDYNDIKSPIEDINLLNLEFKKRFDTRQQEILTDKQLILFGLLQFDIFKYKVLNVNYFDKDSAKPIYIIQIALFRESDLYLNTFSYIGFIKDNKQYITNCKYIGRNSTDSVLLANFYNPDNFTEEIINKNFTNSEILDKNPDSIVEQTKKHAEEYKIKNQYACFNINYQFDAKDTYILPYFTKKECESQFDPYGKSKSVGIFDKPCKEDNECPFFNINKNYKNTFGKCMENGQCELPVNMKKLGYHYFLSDENNKPMCYNCGAKEFKFGSILDSCCDEQYDNDKYPFLNSPDYAFEGDFLQRKNFFNEKDCTVKSDNFNLTCKSVNLKK